MAVATALPRIREQAWQQSSQSVYALVRPKQRVHDVRNGV